MIVLIKPDGTEEVISRPGELPLQEYYELLECRTLEVPGNGFTVNGRQVQFVLDEDGKMTGKPINRKATEAYDDALAADPRGLMPGRDVLVGNVLILTEPNLMT